jgi:hypothetical protein
MCAMTYSLRLVDFTPLRSVISFEDRLYSAAAPPSLKLWSDFHPVVFLEVDDRALGLWGVAETSAEGTPRSLIAELTQWLRAAAASVIFLDYDFRNHLQDDEILRKELAMASNTPVLLPRFFAAGLLPPCDRQTDAAVPIELQTAFDDTMQTGTIASVHSILTLGAYGLTDGTCSFYRSRAGRDEVVSRTAAMLRAVGLLRLKGAARDARFDQKTPGLLVNRWWINNETDLLYDQSGRLAYRRIKASLYIHNHAVDTQGIDVSALKGAIVIMSSTTSSSGDMLQTPVGDLPGALINANLALDLQSPPEIQVPLSVQFGLDVILVIFSACLAIPLCWLPLFKRIGPLGRLTGSRRASLLVREAVVIAAFGLALGVVYLGLAHYLGNTLAGWRFGVLSFLLSVIVVLTIELTAAIADEATELAETVTLRLSRHRRPPTDREAESEPME